MNTTTEQLEMLKQAIEATNSKRMFIRYQAVQLHLQGHKHVEIAPIIGKHAHTVSKYIKDFKNQGIEGLMPKCQEGAFCKLTQHQEETLVDTISRNTPDQVGLKPFKNWNCKLIVAWVFSAFKITYSITGMRDLLHRLGFSYTRPTYVLAKADSEKQAKFIEEFKTTKKTRK